MAKNKTLTIYNSDRYFNIHTKKKSDLDAIKVLSYNEKSLENIMDDLESKSSRYVMKDDRHYLLFNEKYNNDKLIEKIIKHGGKVTYYTDTVVPYYVFKDLSKHQDSTVVYRMRKDFTDKEIDNIALSFMGTKVVVDISVVLPNVNPYEIIRQLHSVKTNVDEVHLSFPRLKEVSDKQKKFYDFDGEAYTMKPEYKVDFADRLRVSLSVWKMYIYILTDDRDHKGVQNVIDKIKKHRKVKI